MGRVAAVAGYQAKVLLVEEEGVLALNGAERDGHEWRPVPVELARGDAEMLERALSTLRPAPSALQRLLSEHLER